MNKKKKYLLTLALLGFLAVPKLDAETKKIDNKLYFVSQIDMTCSRDENLKPFYSKDGKIYLQGENDQGEKTYYRWNEDETCSNVTSEEKEMLIKKYTCNINLTGCDIEDYLEKAKIEDDVELNDNIRIDYIYKETLYNGMLVLGEEDIYDETINYYSYDEQDGVIVEDDTVSMESNLKGLFTDKVFKHAKTDKIDNSVTYYKVKTGYYNEDEEVYVIFEKVTNAKLEDLKDYFVITTREENYDKNEYEYPLDKYNQLKTQYNSGYIPTVEYIMGEYYLKCSEDLETFKYFDEDGNETEFLRNQLLQPTKSYLAIGYNNKYNVYLKSTKELLHLLEVEDIDFMNIREFENYYVIDFGNKVEIYLNGTNELIYKIDLGDEDYATTEDMGNFLLIKKVEQIDEDITKTTRYIIKKYETLEGANQTYKDKDLTFRFSGTYFIFKELKLNGELLDTNNYESKEGSTVITLKNSFLKTLKNGIYTVTAVYKDGVEVSETFTVDTIIEEEKKTEEEKIIEEEKPNKVVENPKTGDNIIFNFISITALLATLFIVLNKYKLNKNN